MGKADNGRLASLKGYKVYYKEGDTVNAIEENLLNKDINNGLQDNTTAKISGLKGLTEYAIIVVTINSADKSSTSGETTATTLSAASAPSVAIMNPIDTNNITSNSITISWTAPVGLGKATDGSDASLKGYKVYYKEGDTVSIDDGTLLNESNNGLQTTQEGTISGLKGLTKYAFIVVTVNSVDKSSTSLVVTETTMSAASAPSMPQYFLTEYSTVDNSIKTLSWENSTDSGTNADGTTATLKGYQIYYKEGHTVSITDETLLNENTNAGIIPFVNTSSHKYSATISGLKEFSTYSIIVVSINSADLTRSTFPSTIHTARLFIKLGADGQSLSNQDGTWSESGTEDAGTKWSCVQSTRETQTTTDDLYWEIKTDDDGARDKDLTYKWGGLTAIGINDPNKEGTYHNDWNTLVNASNDAANNGANGLCGFDDWRVPTVENIASFYTYDGKERRKIDTAIFPYLSNLGDFLWTAIPSSDYNHTTSIYFSRDALINRSDRDVALSIRLVRGESDITDAENSYAFDFWPDSRYTNNGDGTITDSKTGLIWKQCAEGYSGNDCSIEDSNTKFENTNLIGPLAYLETVNEKGFAGNKNWRIPTNDELISLIAFNRQAPAFKINSTMFPNTPEWILTNTEQISNLDMFVINFDDGINHTDTSGGRIAHLRLVRSE